MIFLRFRPWYVLVIQWGPYTSYSSNGLSFNGPWWLLKLGIAVETALDMEFWVDVLLKVGLITAAVHDYPSRLH